RCGIFEILEVTDAMRAELHSGMDEDSLRRLGRRFGWRPLREEGLTLVEEGRSTLEEVLRVTHAEADVRTRAEDSEKRELATAAAGSTA
ncbi:MAG: hypothetical protein IT450_01715, partial [Phycisphaerales bacterium]|nr:hypothetical protein [Phycisphaerales bacterium]